MGYVKVSCRLHAWSFPAYPRAHQETGAVCCGLCLPGGRAACNCNVTGQQMGWNADHLPQPLSVLLPEHKCACITPYMVLYTKKLWGCCIEGSADLYSNLQVVPSSVASLSSMPSQGPH